MSLDLMNFDGDVHQEPFFADDAASIEENAEYQLSPQNLIFAKKGLSVHRVYHLGYEQEVVLKRFHFDESNREQVLSGALAEYQSTMECQHPYVIRCFGFEDDDSSCSLILESAECSLAEYLQRGPSLSDAQKRMFLAQICAALQHIHDKGLVHADLKCENVLIVDGVAKIADFGCSVPHGTFIQNPIGTAPFISPEIIVKHQALRQSDIWSLGVLIYQMTHYVPPFFRYEPIQIFWAVGHSSSFVKFNPLGDFVASVFSSLIQHCTTPLPEGRPSVDSIISCLLASE